MQKEYSRKEVQKNCWTHMREGEKSKQTKPNTTLLQKIETQNYRTTHALCQYNIKKEIISVTYIAQPKNCTLNTLFFPYGVFAVNSWNPSW